MNKEEGKGRKSQKLEQKRNLETPAWERRTNDGNLGHQWKQRDGEKSTKGMTNQGRQLVATLWINVGPQTPKAPMVKVHAAYPRAAVSHTLLRKRPEMVLPYMSESLSLVKLVQLEGGFLCGLLLRDFLRNFVRNEERRERERRHEGC